MNEKVQVMINFQQNYEYQFDFKENCIHTIYPDLSIYMVYVILGLTQLKKCITSIRHINPSTRALYTQKTLNEPFDSFESKWLTFSVSWSVRWLTLAQMSQMTHSELSVHLQDSLLSFNSFTFVSTSIPNSTAGGIFLTKKGTAFSDFYIWRSLLFWYSPIELLTDIICKLY